MPPGIYRLPLELVREVAAQSSSRDIAALALTDRHFHSWVNPCLYEHNIKHEEADAAVWAAARGRMDTLLLLRQANTPSSHLFINKIWLGDDRYGPLLPIEHALWLESELKFTLLHLAAEGGHENVVKWLVQQGANVDAYSTNLCECAYPPLSHHFSWTPLHLAICNSQENTVRLLLANNASLKTSEEFNIEALHTAAAEGSASTILHLSTHPGFDVDVKDHTGRTPLHHAIMASRGPDTVKALLNFGADVQGGCDDSLRPPYTPLWSALAQGDLEVAVMLLENGAKPFVNKDKDSKRVAPYRQQLRRRQRLHQVSLLGVTLRKKNTTENSRRHGVLQRKVIRALLDFGCDIDQDLSRFGSMELTPLTLAASHSSSATVRLLLDRGAKVNAKAGFRSALCHALSESAPASLSESVDKVTALLEHGADLLDPSVIWHLNIRHSSRTMLDTVADNLSPENLNDSLRIPRALGICCIFQERKMYNSIKIHARVQLQATDKDIQYVLEQSACSKRACVPACLDELGPILDEMRPGLTVDGALDQWRDVMSDAAVKWLKEIKGRESSG